MKTDATVLEHKEYSLKWISSKLLLKAQRGIDTVPRMQRDDQVGILANLLSKLNII